jgi:hypothetical protein
VVTVVVTIDEEVVVSAGTVVVGTPVVLVGTVVVDSVVVTHVSSVVGTELLVDVVVSR